MQHEELLLLFIVLAPMFGAVFNGLISTFFKLDKKIVSAVALAAVATSFALALFCFFKLRGLVHEEPSAALSYQAYEWFRVQLAGGGITVPVNVRLSMDALSGMMTLMVTGIGLLIHLYSTGYMSEEPSYARFFAYLNLFMASMLILVLASNLPLMFVGWEGVGVCSYLLIGFWYENSTYAAAGKKAFIVNRIGDFGVLMGMFLLLANTNSFEFNEINAKASELAAGANLGGGTLGISIATLAGLFLFLGCAGKSAQLPLYVWLPDAMAGPTPVSALIHAATMVTSGVYLCCRLSPVLVQSPTAMSVIAVVGTLTALLAASIALVQNQLKKVLAYSTVSQLGFMFAAVGVGAFSAGIFHVFTHAFFKACLFLGAGSVMHAVHAHGDADFKDIGGMKKYMPITNATFFVSCLAIAGFPLTSGFFSKDAILHGALTVGDFFPTTPWLGYAIFGALCLGAFTTAFYMFRLYYLAFTGEFRGGHGHGHGHDDHKDDHGHDDHGHEPHESETAITLPLAVLAFGAVAVGFLGMPAWMHLPDTWSHWLEGVLGAIPGAAEHHHDAKSGWIALIAGSVVGLGGIGLAASKYWNKPWHAVEEPTGLHAFLMDKWRVDGFYNVVIVRPMTAVARMSGNIDRIAVDGLTKLAAIAVQTIGWLFTRLSNGYVHTYGAAVAAGMIGLVWWIQFPHPHVDVATAGDAAHFVAGAGLGYEYQWDFNSDGKQDTEWSKERDVSHAYDVKDLVGVEIVLTHTSVLGLGDYKVRLLNGDSAEIEPRYLGALWQVNPESSVRPLVKYENYKLTVRPGASALRINGKDVTEDQVEVAAGSVLEFGRADDAGNHPKMRVDGVVRSTLSVRTAFGNVGKVATDLAIEPSKAEKTDKKHAALETVRGNFALGGAR